LPRNTRYAVLDKTLPSTFPLPGEGENRNSPLGLALILGELEIGKLVAARGRIHSARDSLEKLREPRSGRLRDFFECSGLFKQVSRTWNHDEFLTHSKLL